MNWSTRNFHFPELITLILICIYYLLGQLAIPEHSFFIEYHLHLTENLREVQSFAGFKATNTIF